jgi:hypothetical protein
VESVSPEETTPSTETPSQRDHTSCEANIFAKIWNAIVNFFRKLFGKPELCVCGKER